MFVPNCNERSQHAKPAVVEKVGTGFRDAAKTFAEVNHIPVVRFGKKESGANRGRLRDNGEPGWRAFDGVGEAGVPAAELTGRRGRR